MSRRFGIEFEIADRASDGWASLANALDLANVRFSNYCDSYEEEEQPIRSEGLCWDIKYDCSCGYEVCTPAMRTKSDWEEIHRVLQALYEAGARTNRTCSAHVHIEVRDFTVPQLSLLGRLWATFEPVIFWTLARSRTDNNYCQPLHYYRKRFWEDLSDRDFRRFIESMGRYTSLNMSEWWRHGRVEFRAHHGTLRYRDIRAWVDFLMILVEAVPQFTTEDHNKLNALDGVDDYELYTALRTFVRRFGGSEKLVDTLTEFVQRRQPERLAAPTA